MFFIFSTFNDDKISMEDLIEKYSKELMKLCYLYLKDYQLAEDAVQDTLIKIYRKYNTFRKESNEKTWVTKIAINTCKNYTRKSYYKQEYMEENLELFLKEDTENLLSSRDEDALNLLNAVYNLPEVYKEVILLYYYKEYSIKEIAEILREKQGTIGVRLKRGRDALKEMVKEDEL